MEQTVGKRLQLLIEDRGYLTLTAFEAATGVKVGTASAIINGRTNPGNKVIALLRRAFPGFNSDWLRDGSGQMFDRNLARTTAHAEMPPTVERKVTTPYLTASTAVDDMTEAQQVSYYKGRWQKAEGEITRLKQLLAEAREAQDHQEAVQLTFAAGGGSFNLASAEAADTYPQPRMVAVRNHDYDPQRFVPAKPVPYERPAVGFVVSK